MAKINGFVVILVSVLSFAVLYGCSKDDLDNDLARKSGKVIVPYDEKIYWNGTIDDNFGDSTVIIVMDRNFSGINKVHEKSFFGDIEIESIEDLTYVTDISTIIYPEDWRQILLLTLFDNSKENVVKAIRHLEKIVGIMHVGPDRFMTAVDD